jgi:hypothetical protein
VRTLKLNDFPTSLKISYYDEVIVIGTQLGRMNIHDYFGLELLDYQIVHSSAVVGIELDHQYKDNRDAGVK